VTQRKGGDGWAEKGRGGGEGGREGGRTDTTRMLAWLSQGWDGSNGCTLNPRTEGHAIPLLYMRDT